MGTVELPLQWSLVQIPLEPPIQDKTFLTKLSYKPVCSLGLQTNYMTTYNRCTRGYQKV